jgi:hypothetical protein
MLPWVCGATQLNALDAEVYLHLDILRISSLVSRLSMVTNWITKIYSFLRGVKEGGKARLCKLVKGGDVGKHKGRPLGTSHSKPCKGRLGKQA